MILFLLMSLAGAADLHVGTGQTYATIQAAVTAASDGDTIVLHNKSTSIDYSERVVFDGVTNLKVKPYGSDVVVVQAPSQYMATFVVDTMYVAIRDLTIKAPDRTGGRAIVFRSETTSLTEHFGLAVCGDVTLTGNNSTDSIGVACAPGWNDTLTVGAGSGGLLTIDDFAIEVETSCVKDRHWDQPWDFPEWWFCSF